MNLASIVEAVDGGWNQTPPPDKGVAAVLVVDGHYHGFTQQTPEMATFFMDAPCTVSLLFF